MIGLLIESVIAAAIVLGLLLSMDQSSRRELGVLVAVAVVVRVAVLLLSTTLLNNPENNGFAFQDDRKYDEVAAEMVEWWDNRRAISPDEINYQAVKNQGYYYVNAALYWLFGSHSAVGSVFNIFVSVLSLFLVVRVGEATWSREVGLRAALLLAVLPDMALWSGLQFKDVTVGFLVLWAVFDLQRVASGLVNLRTIVGSMASLTLLYTFRAEATLLLAVAFIGALVTSSRIERGSRLLLAGGGVVIVAAIGTLILLGISSGYFVGAAIIDQLLSGATVETASLFMNMLNYISASNIEGAGLISLGFIFGIQDLWRLPLALLFVVLIPFPPWPRGDLVASDLLNVASIPWLILMPAVLIGMFKAWRERIDEAKVMLFYTSLNWLVLAIFLFAFNPARNRVASVPLMLLFASAYWPKQQTSAWWAWMAAITGLFLCMLGYVLFV